MGYRIVQGTVRPGRVTFSFDEVQIHAFAGETIAAALIASGVSALRRDSQDRPRGPYCNMGSCFECMVEVLMPAAEGDVSPRPWRSVRACLTTVSPGLVVRSRELARAPVPA